MSAYRTSLLLPALITACLVSGPNTSEAQRRGRFEGDQTAISNGWKFDYAEAKAEAARAKKPMMVVFRCVP